MAIGFRKDPPVDRVSQSIAAAANVSAIFQSIDIGALPSDIVEGLLVAAENAILIQLAVGTLNKEEIDAMRRKIVAWSIETSEAMELDGTADEIRKNHAEGMAAYLKAKGVDGNIN
jgi:hypothetical protein